MNYKWDDCNCGRSELIDDSKALSICSFCMQIRVDSLRRKIEKGEASMPTLQAKPRKRTHGVRVSLR